MFTTPPPFPPTDVFPGQMEGVKLVVNKVLSSHFQVLPLLFLPACPLLFSCPLSPALARPHGVEEQGGESLTSLAWDLRPLPR